MNILDSIKVLSEFGKAVDIGKEIKDPAKWKDRQVLTNKVGLILVTLTTIAKVSGLEIPESTVPWQDMIDYATQAIVGIMMFVNIILTWSTSRKVGPPEVKEKP